MRLVRTILLALCLLSGFPALSQEVRHLLMLDGSITEDTRDTDARSYMPVLDSDGRLCSLLKVHCDNPLAAELALCSPGLAVKKFEYLEGGDVWFWISPSAREITFRCMNYNEVGPLATDFQPGRVYVINLHADKVSVTYPDTYLANYISLKVTNSTINTRVHYGRTPACERGSMHFRQDHTTSIFLPYGKYYVQIVDNLAKTISGVACVTEVCNTDQFTLQPDYGYFKFVSTPTGAKVYIDDCFIGETPYATSNKYASGEHRLKITADNYYDLEETITLNGDGSVQTFQYDLKPRFGRLYLNCSDSGASLYVDGKYVGRGSWNGAVSGNGKHVAEARRDGYRTQQTEIYLEEGQTVSETIPAPIKVYGSLKVTSNPSKSAVYIDGAKYGHTPLTLGELPAGTHSVTIAKTGYISRETEVTVVEGVARECSMTLAKDPASPGPVSLRINGWLAYCPTNISGESYQSNIGDLEFGMNTCIPLNKTRVCLDLGVSLSIYFPLDESSSSSSSSGTTGMMTMNLPMGFGYMIGSKTFYVFPYAGVDPVFVLSKPTASKYENIDFTSANLLWHAGCNFGISCFLVGGGYRASFFPVINNTNVKMGQWVITLGLTF